MNHIPYPDTPAGRASHARTVVHNLRAQLEYAEHVLRDAIDDLVESGDPHTCPCCGDLFPFRPEFTLRHYASAAYCCGCD